MSNRFLSGFRDFFGPDLPRWACELTSTFAVVIGANSDRQCLESQAVSEWPMGAFVEEDSPEARLVHFDSIKGVIRKTFDQLNVSGSDIVMVVPDGACRLSIMKTETFPTELSEQQSFIRWKLKKHVPFDIDTAQLSFKIIGNDNSMDVLVALSPQGLVRQYEDLMESVGFHAGVVIPSTVAALNLLEETFKDILFLKTSHESVTTSIFIGGRLSFYRRIKSRSLYDAVHPTLMYYQDKLGGKGITELVTCIHDPAIAAKSIELSTKLKIPIRSLHSEGVRDVFKPALGAVQL